MTRKDFNYDKTVLVHRNVTLSASGEIRWIEEAAFIGESERLDKYDIEIESDTHIEGDIEARLFHVLEDGELIAN